MLPSVNKAADVGFVKDKPPILIWLSGRVALRRSCVHKTSLGFQSQKMPKDPGFCGWYQMRFLQSCSVGAA